MTPARVKNPPISDKRVGISPNHIMAINIANTGDEQMELLIWVNEIFDPEDPDTFYEEV